MLDHKGGGGKSIGAMTVREGGGGTTDTERARAGAGWRRSHQEAAAVAINFVGNAPEEEARRGGQ